MWHDVHHKCLGSCRGCPRLMQGPTLGACMHEGRSYHCASCEAITQPSAMATALLLVAARVGSVLPRQSPTSRIWAKARCVRSRSRDRRLPQWGGGALPCELIKFGNAETMSIAEGRACALHTGCCCPPEPASSSQGCVHLTIKQRSKPASQPGWTEAEGTPILAAKDRQDRTAIGWVRGEG